jgi:hypothetical protein
MLFIFAIVGFAVNAQQIEIFVSTPEVLVGQPDTLTIKIISPFEKVILPSFHDTLSEQLEVLHVGKVDSSKSGFDFEFTQQVYFTSFDTGIFTVPAVVFQMKDTAVFSLSSEVKVVGVVVDLTKNIQGIHDIEEAPVTLKETLVMVGKVLFVVLFIVLIVWILRYFYLKYKFNKNNKIVIEPEIPFMDTFWERLALIEQEKFWQKGEVKKFHSQVTGLMRSYLEYRFGISAMEQTTDEILTQLQIPVSDKMLYAKIEQTLRFADMVKFAKATGVQDQHEKAIVNLRELVGLTDLGDSKTNTLPDEQ